MMFLNPLFLGALALASVPLIIHLLNRRRFQVIDWAPMKYLKLTLRTNRRRLKLEQWILLAIRTLVIVLLVLAVSRPIIGNVLGSVLGGRSRTSQILVIDDSLSMSYQGEGGAAFHHAREAAAELIRELSAQDNVTVLLTSDPATPLVKETRPSERPNLAEDLRRLEPSHAASNWAATLAAVNEHLGTATFPSKRVTVFTDLRKSGWTGDASELTRRWADDSVAVRIHDAGSRRTDNVALVELRQEEPPVVLPGSTVTLRALIRNDTGSPLPPTQATLAVGDAERPVMLPEIPAGQTAQIPLTVTPREHGHFAVRLAIPSLPGDGLAEDNRRWLALDVRERLDVLLVDGEPGQLPFESETDFLTLAFTIGSEAWHIQRITDTEALIAAARGKDLVVLANVATLRPDQVEALEKLVESGAGLMVFAGEQMDLAAYNERLVKGGMGLLPGALDKIYDEPVTGLVVESLERSPMEPLSRLVPAALARIKARRYLGVDLPRKETDGPTDAPEVRVLARWNDGRPAVIEKAFGRSGGRVLFWTVTADREWSDWPVEPSYVLAVRSAALALARAGATQDTLTVGQPIRLAFAPDAKVLEPRVRVPNVEAAQTLLLEPGEGGQSAVRFGRTLTAGVYGVEWKNELGAAEAWPFAVNPDKAESDLESITDDELTRLFSPLPIEIVRKETIEQEKAARGKEIWKTLAIIVLAMMAVETVFAVWVGRER